MDTTRITEPITSHLSVARPMIATVTDATTGLAEQVSDQVADVDLTETMRRTRRAVAGVVPWMTVRRRTRTRRWLMLAVALGVVGLAVTLYRSRSTDSAAPQQRDDWKVGSANGTGAAADRDDRREREHTSSGAER